MTLRSYQLSVVHLSGSTETIEFTASTPESAVQSLACARLKEGRPISEVTTGDGRTFKITNKES